MSLCFSKLKIQDVDILLFSPREKSNDLEALVLVTSVTKYQTEHQSPAGNSTYSILYMSGDCRCFLWIAMILLWHNVICESLCDDQVRVTYCISQ